MELFAKLFSSLLVFVYHCFDRIVINGYLSGLSRPEQVVYFFRDVIGVPVVDKAVLSKRTGDFRGWGGCKVKCVNGHRKHDTKETRWPSTSTSSTNCWRTTRSPKTLLAKTGY